ncbi:hypothetical protein GCM10012275_20560 [Longimycelium tulufanense]|uniref:DUF6545 domain-containing protein n=1 Tax=Longimycelium tulufanense TaxID=907463 RepID=A0A8J3CBL9_9PSEU|nr:MAB_1171c family putative transporter [Longimycelium tulufanense]GGM49545.1 hypothetical protein GCM10012275_20560 [Longimycelium tulufanense]
MTATLHDLGTRVLVAGTIALWLALALRLPGAVRSRPQRRLLIAVAGLAGSITVYLDPVTALLSQSALLANSCGIVMNVWGVLSSAFILDFVLAAVARRLPWLVYGAAAAVSVTLVLLDTESSPQSGCVTSIDVPWYSPFWWLLCVAHVVAVLPCAVLCARYSRHATTRPLRIGLLLLAAGFASSTVFWSVLVLGFLLTRSPWLGALFPLNIGLTAWLMIAGVSLPLLVQARRRWQDLRTFRRLGPLWQELVAAVPHVELPEPKESRWSTDLRLYRRVIEIRDALLVLRDYVDNGVVDAARAHARSAAPGSEDGGALTTACWLVIAEHAKANGATPRPAGEAADTERTASDDEWAQEVRFLESLARARRHPLVQDFARQHGHDQPLLRQRHREATDDGRAHHTG